MAEEAFIKGGVQPDVVSAAPSKVAKVSSWNNFVYLVFLDVLKYFILLQVTYPSGVRVELGNELTPRQVKDQPKVEWEASSDNFYTLAMTGTHWKCNYMVPTITISI